METPKKRYPVNGRVRCSRCDKRGHNAATCQNPSRRSLNLDVFKQREREKRIRVRDSNRALITQFKESTPCMDCGRLYPACSMDFDHRPGEEKRDDVSRIIGSGVSMRRVLVEVAKCDLVCANCHRVRSRDRKQFIRKMGYGSAV